ncbi:hypothetical protein NMG60_11015509 [Bertholletia excelsa]
MATRTGSPGTVARENRVYQDFDPPMSTVEEDDHDTVLVHLPGFRREHLSVQLSPTNKLRISGEVPVGVGGEERWMRFYKEMDLSSTHGCSDYKKFRAMFGKGILSVTIPKLQITSTGGRTDNNGGLATEKMEEVTMPQGLQTRKSLLLMGIVLVLVLLYVVNGIRSIIKFRA